MDTNVAIIALYGIEKLHDFPVPVEGAIAFLIAGGRAMAAGYFVREEE